MALVVCYRKCGVMLDGEIFIGHADEYTCGYAAELINEENLIVEAANMLEDSIRRCHRKTSACEWKPSIGFNVNELYFRESSSELHTLAYSACRNIPLVRVASL